MFYLFKLKEIKELSDKTNENESPSIHLCWWWTVSVGCLDQYRQMYWWTCYADGFVSNGESCCAAMCAQTELLCYASAVLKKWFKEEGKDKESLWFIEKSSRAKAAPLLCAVVLKYNPVSGLLTTIGFWGRAVRSDMCWLHFRVKSQCGFVVQHCKMLK